MEGAAPASSTFMSKNKRNAVERHWLACNKQKREAAAVLQNRPSPAAAGRQIEFGVGWLSPIRSVLLRCLAYRRALAR